MKIKEDIYINYQNLSELKNIKKNDYNEQKNIKILIGIRLYLQMKVPFT